MKPRRAGANQGAYVPDLHGQEKGGGALPGGKTRNAVHLSGQAAGLSLDCLRPRLYLSPMTLVLAQKVELQDRARLRERFFGAARTVLARL